MAIKVNKYVRFLNNFTAVGREANLQIKRMAKNNSNPIYQNRYFGQSLALLQKNVSKLTKEDCFCCIQKDGSKVFKHTSNKKRFGFKLFSLNKEVIDKYDMPVSSYKKEVVFNLNNKTIEEYATKKSGVDTPSVLIVRSKAERQSQFPSTELGGSVHPAIAVKNVLSNGDTVYFESYLKR